MQITASEKLGEKTEGTERANLNFYIVALKVFLGSYDSKEEDLFPVNFQNFTAKSDYNDYTKKELSS